jgi:hypothetical protein
MVLSRLTSSNGAVVSPKQSPFDFIPAAGSKPDIFASSLWLEVPPCQPLNDDIQPGIECYDELSL